MQGFNMGRYVPPDVEGTISANALNKKHALGARASKLRTEGILTVRFEMPFAVWCATCPKPTIIGQGVRFNAEKKKVGAYYSTPIWSFRMHHADCGGAIEIRTDPARSEYVVVAGGTRRDTGDAKDDDSLLPSKTSVGEIVTEKEREALRTDAFSRLEKTIEDRGVLIERSHRIAELEDASFRAWDDPYTQNRKLRSAFRAGRKAREQEAASTEDLQERMSLGIEIMPATTEDARRAALVEFGVAAALGASADTQMDNTCKAKDAALVKPLFGTPLAHHATKTTTPDVSKPETTTAEKKGTGRLLKTELKASQTRESLASEIRCNTRVAQDPFLQPFEPRGADNASKAGPSRIQGIKRKQAAVHAGVWDKRVKAVSSALGNGEEAGEEVRHERAIHGNGNGNGNGQKTERREERNGNGCEKQASVDDTTSSTSMPLVEYDSD
ncbi:CWC16 protein [Xylaria sp. CBS 124048]|nr:CWC16 protein [Xylaria sp. CBS 124048]